MTDQSMFGKTDEVPVTPAVVTPPNDALANLLASIKNEAGVQKYKSIEDALTGAANAQTYIAQLKAEKAEAEARAATALGAQDKQAALEATLAELMAKVNAPQTQGDAITPDVISAHVQKVLEQRDQAQTATQNQLTVVQAFVSTFGDNATAEAKFDALASELGLTRAELNGMAAKSPKAVLKAAGITAPTQGTKSFAPPPNATSAPAFKPHSDSLIGKNKESLALGATTQDMMAEFERSKKMVEELEANGMSVADLTNPKVYFKHFG